MTKWDVELVFNAPFTVTGVEAETEEEALETAKKCVIQGTDMTTDRLVEAGHLEFDMCSYIRQR